jgi:hypothetical protein
MVSPWFARLPEIAAFVQGGKSQFPVFVRWHSTGVFCVESQHAEIPCILRNAAKSSRR